MVKWAIELEVVFAAICFFANALTCCPRRRGAQTRASCSWPVTCDRGRSRGHARAHVSTLEGLWRRDEGLGLEEPFSNS